MCFLHAGLRLGCVGWVTIICSSAFEQYQDSLHGVLLDMRDA